MKDLDESESHGMASLQNGQLEETEEPEEEKETKQVSREDIIPITTDTKKRRLQEKDDQPSSQRNRTGKRKGMNRTSMNR